MKHLLTTALALVLCAGCTEVPTQTTAAPAPTVGIPTTLGPSRSASPSAGESASPTARALRDVPIAPKKASDFDVIMSDPKLLVTEPDDPWGPETFAVFGNQVVLEDSVDFGMLTYTEGRRTGRGQLDTDEWTMVDDLQARDSELYVLQGDGDTATNRKVHVYSRGAGGALTLVRVLPGEFIRGNGPASISFAGPNVVGSSFNDPDVLLDGPGPLPDLTLDVTKKAYTVELAGAPPLRIHTRYAPAGIDLLRLDDDYAYFFVEDYDLDSDAGDYAADVYRIALTSAGTDASYTLAASPGYVPDRQVQVFDGQVYQLRGTDKAVQVLRLHPNP